MTRPLTLVYQEFAEQTPQVIEPDLDTVVIGPAYQILDYLDDKEDLEVSAYGTLNANNPYTPPPAATPAIVLAAPPSIVAGGWVDPLSIGVYAVHQDSMAPMALHVSLRRAISQEPRMPLGRLSLGHCWRA